MILVPKRASYKEILERYEEKNEFSFKSSRVLPKEQIGEIERVFKFNGKKNENCRKRRRINRCI